MSPHRRSARSVFLSGVLLAVLLGMATARADVFVQHGVVFYPSGSNAKMSFTLDQRFTTVDVDSTAAIFDGVRFEMGKTPTGNPATISVSEWHPQEASGVAVNWTVSSVPGSTVYVNISGLPSINYTFYIDGNPSATLTGPSIHTSYGVSTTNQFLLRSGSITPITPSNPSGFDITPLIPLIAIVLIFIGIGAFAAIFLGDRGKKGP